MFCLLVVQCTDEAYRVVVFTNISGVSISLTVVPAGGSVGGVGDLAFLLTGELETLRAHFLALLRSGREHHRPGVLESTGGGVQVKQLDAGHFQPFGLANGRFPIDK